MAQLSSDARFSLMSEPKPGKAISVLNDLLYQNTARWIGLSLAAALLDTQAHGDLRQRGPPSPLLLRYATGG